MASSAATWDALSSPVMLVPIDLQQELIVSGVTFTNTPIYDSPPYLTLCGYASWKITGCMQNPVNLQEIYGMHAYFR